MNLQKTIVSKYKESYPKHTLKQMSQLTGIQVTRLFRVLNGSEMKISEYESFENCILRNTNSQEETSHNEYVLLAKECALKLSSKRLSKIIKLMNYSIKLSSLTATINKTQFNSQLKA